MPQRPGKPPSGPASRPSSGSIIPTGSPHGSTQGPAYGPVPAPPSVQPVTRRRDSKATTYAEQGRPEEAGRPHDDIAEKERRRADARRALFPTPPKLRDSVAAAVFRILTNYDHYFVSEQTRAQIANTISSAVEDTLRAITETASRRTSITRTIETTIDWTMSAVATHDIPGIKRGILAAIERTVTL